MGIWDTKLCDTLNAKVADIEWTLTEETRTHLETEGRKVCVEKAMHKARDFAEALGIGRSAVRAVQLVNKGTQTISAHSDLEISRMRGSGKTLQDQGYHSVFANEEIRLQDSITVKCVAD